MILTTMTEFPDSDVQAISSWHSEANLGANHSLTSLTFFISFIPVECPEAMWIVGQGTVFWAWKQVASNRQVSQIGFEWGAIQTTWEGIRCM